MITGMASRGEEALELVKGDMPDLVLMDIKLSGEIDGIATAECIHEFADVPVVYLTAFADDETLQRAKLSEPFGYILKPFEERDLITNIEIGLYKHKMEKALREREERYSLALQGANDGIWDWNLITDEVYVSQRFKSMLGYQESELGTQLPDILALIHPDDLEKLSSIYFGLINSSQPHLEVEHRMLHKNGQLLWVLTRGAITYKDGRSLRAAGSMTDITLRKRSEEQTLYDALHDGLTGLPNRALFLDRLDQAIERHRRNPTRLYALLHLDLDRFKVINDSFGQQVGDTVLIKIALMLKNLFRASDSVARLGGDDFAILVDDFSDPELVNQLLQRVQDTIRQPIFVNNIPVLTSASIGIVNSSLGCEKAELAMRDAEIAMYHAKMLGAGQYQFFDLDLRQQALSQLELEHALRGALDRHEYSLVYQPIIHLGTGKIASFEALLRWESPGHRNVSPIKIITALEASGQIIPVGKWVLEEACRQLSEWHKKYHLDTPLAVNVNVSGKQLPLGFSVESIQQLLDSSGLQANQLVLEITESIFLENPYLTKELMVALDKIGVELHIDDFGTGYSSLSYLEKLPVSTIKIDQSFLNGLDNQETREIVRTIIHLAHKLGMRTTAEGIERKDQLVKLKEMGCNFAQGHLFCRPLEPAAIEEMFLEPLLSNPNHPGLQMLPLLRR
jgi:diguanylate cyclase (GGDEF)-like protein/PAS domain S-box-containing protein